MKCQVREILASHGCKDETLITALEREWLNLDPQTSRSRFARIVFECGTDLGRMSTFFQETFNFDKRCSADLCRLFSKKLSWLQTVSRQVSTDIKYAKWRAWAKGELPCRHESLDGKKYQIAKGLKFRGEYVYPGLAFECHCTAAPIIPGFDD